MAIPYNRTRLVVKIFFTNEEYYTWRDSGFNADVYYQEHFINPPSMMVDNHPVWFYYIVKEYCSNFVKDLFEKTPKGKKYIYHFETLQNGEWVIDRKNWYALNNEVKELIR